MLVSNRVRKVAGLGVLAVMTVFVGACASTELVAQNRIARAESLPPAQCADAMPAERTTRLLARPEVLEVEPAVDVQRRTKGVPSSRVTGANLRFAAPPGVSSAWLQREIECHQAEVALGLASAADNDPYVLPNDWLEIQVHEKGSSFVVATRAGTREAAAAALDRAKRFQGVAF
jgi:hypothetical protein